MQSINIIDLGLIAYEEALKIQQIKLNESKTYNHSYILVLEHLPVITLGKFATDSDLLTSKTKLLNENIQIINTDRGGKMTAHMPGQLVVYPILDLYHFKLTPKKYVSLLENTIIDFLVFYGISAITETKNPGVWVNNNKIAAIGVRFVEHYSMHGLALNINNDLSLFDSFVPCGISGRGVTSIYNETGLKISVNEIKLRFADLLMQNLQQMS